MVVFFFKNISKCLYGCVCLWLDPYRAGEPFWGRRGRHWVGRTPLRWHQTSAAAHTPAPHSSPADPPGSPHLGSSPKKHTRKCEHHDTQRHTHSTHKDALNKMPQITLCNIKTLRGTFELFQGLFLSQEWKEVMDVTHWLVSVTFTVWMCIHFANDLYKRRHNTCQSSRTVWKMKLFLSWQMEQLFFFKLPPKHTLEDVTLEDICT